MIFGSTHAFAIEVMSEPDLPIPSAVWGRMQIWCDGCSIGHFDDPYCALYGSYVGFKALNKQLASLWLDEFSGLDDQQLWNLLARALYGCDNDVRTLEEIRNDAQRYGQFDFLTNWGEQFDGGGQSFILCTPGQRVRILNRCLPEGKGLALVTSLAHAQLAISEFITWFEQEASRLGHPVV